MLAFVTLSLFVASTVAFPTEPRIITKRQLLESYDYVVVGSGTAGSTVAARLAENPDVSVLVIEAGPLDNSEEFITVPRQAGAARNTRYDWNFTTVPQTFVNNKIIGVPAGRVVGGASVLNGMAYDRGAASDYDAWVDLGNPGWGWSDLLPFFKKNEKFTPPPKDFADKYGITWDPAAHGTDGPIHASYPTVMSNMNKNWIDGLATLNIPKEIDGHNGRALNVFYSPNSLHATERVRSYAKVGYFLPSRSKSNFHYLLETTVTKLVTETSEGSVKVSSVEFATSRTAAKQTVKVNKEVVVSAGAVGSPRILQVSGIGPKAHLDRVGIPTVLDLPGVGSNYQDHSFQSFSGFLQSPPPAEPTSPNPELEYRQNRTGPWTASGPTLFAFVPFPKISTRSAEILSNFLAQDPAAHLAAGTHPTVVAGYKAQQAILAKRLGTDLMAVTELVWQGGSTIYSTQHPLSRGTILVNSASVFDQPSIDFRYGSNPLDFDILAETVRFLRRAMTTAPIAQLRPFEFSPGAGVTTDAQLRDYNKQSMSTMFHSCCTNPMQPKDLGGVVDANLKVYGASNLRVVDASILPLIPGTHIQSTVYASAEKLADLLKSSA